MSDSLLSSSLSPSLSRRRRRQCDAETGSLCRGTGRGATTGRALLVSLSLASQENSVIVRPRDTGKCMQCLCLSKQASTLHAFPHLAFPFMCQCGCQVRRVICSTDCLQISLRCWLLSPCRVHCAWKGKGSVRVRECEGNTDGSPQSVSYRRACVSRLISWHRCCSPSLPRLPYFATD